MPVRGYFVLAVWLVACGRIDYDPRRAAAEDASIDASADASMTDAAVDAASVDASMDAAIDASIDAGQPDASPPTGRAACCTAWCQDELRFGGTTADTQAYLATDRTVVPNCSSSTGCTCAISGRLSSTYTIITGDVCDAHNFATGCSGMCDGSRCPTIEIAGRLNAITDECVCIGTDTMTSTTKDVWSSTCAENDGFMSFVMACAGS